MKYHEPKYYKFEIAKVELDEIKPLKAKGEVDFLDESKKKVVMDTEFYLNLLDRSDLKNQYILAYKTLYEWAFDDIERYNKFVEKQKELFGELDKH